MLITVRNANGSIAIPRREPKGDYEPNTKSKIGNARVPESRRSILAEGTFQKKSS